MRRSLQNDGAVPVVPMLVIFENRISIGITSNTFLEVVSIVGCNTSSRTYDALDPTVGRAPGVLLVALLMRKSSNASGLRFSYS